MLGLIAGVNTISARTIGDVKVKPVEGSKKAVVTINNYQGKKVNVSVSSENGYTNYYKEAISGNNSYSKIYDLKEFEDGSYRIVFDDEYETLEKVIHISGDELKVEHEVKFMKPKFNETPEKLYVYFTNLHNEEVNISIYDETQKIHSEKITDSQFIRKKFDITQLHQGTYSLWLDTDTKSYHYTFTR
jgi:hypothetical protein